MLKHASALFLLVLAATGVYFYLIAWYTLSAESSSLASWMNVGCDNNHDNAQLQSSPQSASLKAFSSSSSVSSSTGGANQKRLDLISFEDSYEMVHDAVPGWFDQPYEDAQYDPNAVRDLTHLERIQNKKQKKKGTLKGHFHGICGHYQFNITSPKFPTVSIIMTTQNEEPGWMTTSIQSILARTPPHLLQQIILVDDNGAHDNPDLRQARHDLEAEFLILGQIEKVSIIHNPTREGCARSRLIGARVATGDVLVFLDSHIEMMSSTWYQHLALPILEQEHTMAVQTIEVISDAGGEDYYIPGGQGHGIFDAEVIFRWLLKGFTDFGPHGKNTPAPAPRNSPKAKQQKEIHNPLSELQNNRHWYATPVGPGALFGMRADDFWRVGGYDTGLYVWGGENIELALKTWMCGGRVVMVPCSRAGHLFRSERLKKKDPAEKNWPPPIPLRTQEHAGVLKYPNGTHHRWKGSAFHKITTRNTIRVVELWVGDHPAREAYYQKAFGMGREQLPPEWRQYVNESDTDPAMLYQKQLKRENQCRDFEWYDKQVLMKLVGKHHPWYEQVQQMEAKKKQQLQQQQQQQQRLQQQQQQQAEKEKLAAAAQQQQQQQQQGQKVANDNH